MPESEKPQFPNNEEETSLSREEKIEFIRQSGLYDGEDLQNIETSSEGELDAIHTDAVFRSGLVLSPEIESEQEEKGLVQTNPPRLVVPTPNPTLKTIVEKGSGEGLVRIDAETRQEDSLEERKRFKQLRRERQKANRKKGAEGEEYGQGGSDILVPQKEVTKEAVVQPIQEIPVPVTTPDSTTDHPAQTPEPYAESQNEFKNTPRIIQSGPAKPTPPKSREALSVEMKKAAAAKTPEAWIPNEQAAEELSAAHGSKFTPGYGIGQEANLRAVQNLKAALDSLGVEYDASKIVFKAGNQTGRQDKDIITVDHKATPEEIKTALEQHIPKRKNEEPKGLIRSESELTQPEPQETGLVETEQVQVEVQEPDQAIAEPKVEQNIPSQEPEQQHQTANAETEEQKEKAEQELRERLEKTREKYVEAKQKLDKYGSLKRLGDKVGPYLGRHGAINTLRNHLAQETKESVKKAVEEAEAEYDKARADYVGAEIERSQAETLDLLKSHLEKYGRLDDTLKSRIGQKIYEIGELNLGKYFEKLDDSKFANRALKWTSKNIKLKTVVYGTLLYSGFTASALAIRALNGALGAERMSEHVRKSFAHKSMSIEKINSLQTLEEVEKQLGSLRTQMYYGPNTFESITKRADYQALLNRERQLMENDFSPPERAQLLAERWKVSKSIEDEKKKKESRGRKVTTGIGVATGSLLGNAVGIVSEYLPSMKSGLQGSPDVSKTLERIKDAIGDKPVSSHVSKIEIGSRGIEGTLIDLKNSDPEKYMAMMERLHEEYPGSKAKDSTLIHRMVKKLADENDFTVDGGGNDLSKLEAGNITITDDGEVALDTKTLDFVNTKEIQDEFKLAPAETAEATEPKIGPENIEQETLDFKKLSPDSPSAKVPEVYPDAANTIRINEARAENSFESLYQSLEARKKTSDALKDVLGDDYKKFLKKVVNIDARELNKIQTFNVSDILDQYNNDQISPRQQKKYHGLIQIIRRSLEEHPEQASEMRKETLRKFVLRVAVERKTNA